MSGVWVCAWVCICVCDNAWDSERILVINILGFVFVSDFALSVWMCDVDVCDVDVCEEESVRRSVWGRVCELEREEKSQHYD